MPETQGILPIPRHSVQLRNVGAGELPCQKDVAALAEPEKPQRTDELGDIRQVFSDISAAQTPNHPQHLKAGAAKVARQTGKPVWFPTTVGTEEPYE